LSEQEWKRKEYETWDEAFQGLAPVVRQQSVRVAAYTQVLFLEACHQSYGKKVPGGGERIRGQYADLAYKCGLYHQLGKALVPPEYQLWQKDYTEEERSVYRKYTTDGRLLVASLQERSQRAKDRRQGQWTEVPTQNIPWLMVRESCEQHMERWDGSGYPAGIKGDAISPMAQIVGLAKELDRLAAETPSETPFDKAYETLTGQAGTLWSEDLIQVLKKARGKCQEVYQKYIHYTKTLPETIPLLLKKPDRPMGLTYRPMTGSDGQVIAYEAVPWFGGIAGRPGETESIQEIEAMLERIQMVTDITMYFLYEAADTLYRIQNCKIPRDGILVQVLPSFYRQGSQLKQLTQLFQDQPIVKEQLRLTIPQDVLVTANKGTMEVIQRYLRNGLVLVVDDYDPAVLPIETVKELGFTHLRLSPTLYLKEETAEQIRHWKEAGMILYGKDVADHDTMAWLTDCHISYLTGPLTGLAVGEDELIRDGLQTGELA
jgi:EAL domain-containing protein (putative c-di-GMP-specific phosphodiesterase class I)